MNNIMDFWRNEWNAVTDTSATVGVDDTEMFFCRIHNDSNHLVYYKPEKETAAPRNKVKPHTVHWQNVDGIATCLYKDKVYKIPGEAIYHPSVWVSADGSVEIKDINKNAIEFYKKNIRSDYKYGWMNLDELDDSWKSLFSLAENIIIED